MGGVSDFLNLTFWFQSRSSEIQCSKETFDGAMAFLNAYRERSQPAGTNAIFHVLDKHNHLRWDIPINHNHLVDLVLERNRWRLSFWWFSAMFFLSGHMMMPRPKCYEISFVPAHHQGRILDISFHSKSRPQIQSHLHPILPVWSSFFLKEIGEWKMPSGWKSSQT